MARNRIERGAEKDAEALAAKEEPQHDERTETSRRGRLTEVPILALPEPAHIRAICEN
jgi:hypothetical protein